MGTDVQTQDRNILPYRSPLNYRQAFCWRLKRELIKLAPILLDKKKKKEKGNRRIARFLQRLVNSGWLRDVFFLFSEEGESFFSAGRFEEFLWHVGEKNRCARQSISTRVDRVHFDFFDCSSISRRF